MEDGKSAVWDMETSIYQACFPTGLLLKFILNLSLFNVKNVFFMLLSLWWYLFHENETFATVRGVDFHLFRDCWSGLQRYVDELFFWFQLISLVLPILKGYFNLLLGSSARRISATTLISNHEKCTFFLCKYHFRFTNFLKILSVWNVFLLVVDQLFSSVSIGIIRPFISRSLWISQYLTLNSLLVAAFFVFFEVYRFTKI